MTLIFASPVLPTQSLIYTHIVVSGSMEPTVHTGDVAFIKPISIKHVKKGDVIAFSSPKNAKQIILHRVTEKITKNNSVFLKTKGDHNKTEDNWIVPAFNIKGIYVFSIPKIGYIAEKIKTVQGFALFLGIPAIILILIFIKSIRDGIIEEVERRVKKEQAKTLTILFFLNVLLSVFFIINTQMAHAFLTTKLQVHGISIAAKKKPKHHHPHPKVTHIPTPSPTFTPSPTPKPKCHKFFHHDTCYENFDRKKMHFRLMFFPGKSKFKLLIMNTRRFSRLDYEISYDSDQGKHGVSASIDLNSPDFYESPPIYLGTCSSEECTSHHNVKKFHVKITARDSKHGEEKYEQDFSNDSEYDEYQNWEMSNIHEGMKKYYKEHPSQDE